MTILGPKSEAGGQPWVSMGFDGFRWGFRWSFDGSFDGDSMYIKQKVEIRWRFDEIRWGFDGIRWQPGPPRAAQGPSPAASAAGATKAFLLTKCTVEKVCRQAGPSQAQIAQKAADRPQIVLNLLLNWLNVLNCGDMLDTVLTRCSFTFLFPNKRTLP